MPGMRRLRPVVMALAATLAPVLTSLPPVLPGLAVPGHTSSAHTAPLRPLTAAHQGVVEAVPDTVTFPASRQRPVAPGDGPFRSPSTGDIPFQRFDLPNPVRAAFEDIGDYDFAIAHVTDTQYLSEGAVAKETEQERRVWADAYGGIARWIADEHRRRRIAFVAHTGDVIENWHDQRDDPAYRATAEAELAYASGVQQVIDDAGVPNAVIPGNHDNKYGTDNGPDSLFNQAFGPARYTALADTTGWRRRAAEHQSWQPDDNANSATLFSAGGLDFVGVALGFGVTDEEVAWADAVLRRHRDRNAIVLTHAYGTPSVNRDGRGGGFSDDGRRVLEGVLEPNPHVVLVLSGHEHGVSIQTRHDVGRAGNHVVELLADYQFYTVGSDEVGVTEVGGYGTDTPLLLGSSFFRLLQFDVDRSEVAIDTYSPLLDDFGATDYDDRHRYDGTEDDLRLPVQLTSRRTSFTTRLIRIERDDRAPSAERRMDAAAPPAPVNVVAPSIAGTPQVGRGLRADIGEWEQDSTTRFTAQWLRDGQPIPDATGGDLRLTEVDAGARVSVRITASTPGRTPVVVEAEPVVVAGHDGTVTSPAALGLWGLSSWLSAAAVSGVGGAG